MVRASGGGAQARAGHSGRVTSLYSEDMVDLVEAVKKNVTAGLPVVRVVQVSSKFRRLVVV